MKETVLGIGVGLILGVVALPTSAQLMPQDNWYESGTWGGPGSASNQFNNPRGMVVASDGWLYVADSGNDRVQVLTTDGTFVGNWPTANHPTDIAEGTNGLLYVCTHADKIQVFTHAGSLVNEWGTSGSATNQFDDPNGITVGSNGTVYVADTDNYRIQLFNSDGAFINSFGSYGDAPGEFEGPFGVASGPDGRICVTDRDSRYGRVQVFDPDGTFITEWGGRQFTGIDVAADGLIFVLEHLVIAGSLQDVLITDGTWSEIRSFHHGMGGYGATTGLAVGPDGDLYLSTDEKDWVRQYRRCFRTAGPGPPQTAPQPYVRSAQQREGTTWMDIDYRVIDTDTPTVDVAVLGFVDGKDDMGSVIPLRTFVENTETNLGVGVSANRDHRLTWDVSTDWSTAFGELQVEVLAMDSPELMDFHFITVPSNGSNPELTINRMPVTDSDLRSCWYWLIATNDPAITLVDGAILGAGGAYDGEVLYYGTGTYTAVESEPNNGFGEADPIGFMDGWAAVSGQLSGNDYYQLVTTESNTVCSFTLLVASVGSNADAEMRFQNTEGTSLVSSGDTDGIRDLSLSYTASEPGTYYLKVDDEGEDGSYLLIAGLNSPAGLTTGRGFDFLCQKMGVRRATSAEVSRALEATTPGSISQWTPRIQIGPGDRPAMVNEYGFDSGSSPAGWWVVPAP